MNVNDPLVAAVIALASVVVIFPVFREAVCWYWKINRMVELLAGLREAVGEHSYAATDYVEVVGPIRALGPPERATSV